MTESLIAYLNMHDDEMRRRTGYVKLVWTGRRFEVTRYVRGDDGFYSADKTWWFDDRGEALNCALTHAGMLR